MKTSEDEIEELSLVLDKFLTHKEFGAVAGIEERLLADYQKKILSLPSDTMPGDELSRKFSFYRGAMDAIRRIWIERDRIAKYKPKEKEKALPEQQPRKINFYPGG